MPLTADLVQAIEPWFDDAETIRYLGDRTWAHDALRLDELMASGRWPEADVVERHSWVAFDEKRPVALLGVEAYDNRTASLSIVVCPDARRRGYGARLIGKARDWAGAHDITQLVVGAEPENIASRALLDKARFQLQGTG